MASRRELVGALGALLRRLDAAASINDLRDGGVRDTAVRVFNSAQRGDIAPLPWTPLRKVAHGSVSPQQVADAVALTGVSEAEALAAFARIAAEESLWMNNTYQVSVRDLGEGGRCLSIKRIDQEPVHDWRDLQRIKNQLVGPECEMVELYPAESRHVDTANQYYLWGTADPTFRFGFGFDERLVTKGSASHHHARERPMLADDLLAAVGTSDDHYQGAFSLLAGHLKRAQRFDLSPNVMRSAYTISHSPIGPQLRALALCKLPFRRTWFEWPGTFLAEPNKRTDTYAPVPKRMGALVETDDSLQRGTMTYAWLHPHAGANICPLVVSFDWREGAEPPPDVSNIARWKAATEQDWADLETKHPNLAQSRREDVLTDFLHFGILHNPMMATFINLAPSQAGLNALLSAAVKDIEGEPPMLRAAIMLLNSRNLAVQEPRPVPVKLNRARARAGKKPLLDYTHVHVRLTRALGARAGMPADRRSPSRLHLVRGHFKIRKTGIYWWSPFPRGTADPAHPIRQQQRSVAL